MILCIGEVLTANELKSIADRLAQAAFVDGKTTAGWHAQAVKHNRQLPQDAPDLEPLRQLIFAALQRHSLF